MADKLKRIGMLTGGGDCPGLNAVIRAVAKAAMDGGLEVVGIEDEYLGLIENRLIDLSYDDVSGILTRGRTILGSCNKANPARYAVPDGKSGWEITDVRDQVSLEQCDPFFSEGIGDENLHGHGKFLSRWLEGS